MTRFVNIFFATLGAAWLLKQVADAITPPRRPVSIHRYACPDCAADEEQYAVDRVVNALEAGGFRVDIDTDETGRQMRALTEVLRRLVALEQSIDAHLDAHLEQNIGVNLDAGLRSDGGEDGP